MPLTRSEILELYAEARRECQYLEMKSKRSKEAARGFDVKACKARRRWFNAEGALNLLPYHNEGS